MFGFQTAKTPYARFPSGID